MNAIAKLSTPTLMVRGDKEGEVVVLIAVPLREVLHLATCTDGEMADGDLARTMASGWLSQAAKHSMESAAS